MITQNILSPKPSWASLASRSSPPLLPCEIRFIWPWLRTLYWNPLRKLLCKISQISSSLRPLLSIWDGPQHVPRLSSLQKTERLCYFILTKVWPTCVEMDSEYSRWRRKGQTVHWVELSPSTIYLAATQESTGQLQQLSTALLESLDGDPTTATAHTYGSEMPEILQEIIKGSDRIISRNVRVDLSCVTC